MGKKSLLRLAMIMCAMVMVITAQAQYGYDNEVKMNEWDVHAGIAWFSGDTQNNTTWIAGVGYEFPMGNSMGMNAITLSADYYPVETLADETVSVVPILVGYKWYSYVGDNEWYFGAGVGTRWVSEDIAELEMDKGMIFGWGLNVGVYIDPAFFGQIRYLAGSHPGDDALFTLELGYKF